MEEKQTPKHPHHLSEQKPESIFSAMPPKFAFWAGFITAVAAVSLLGFLVMLNLLLKKPETTTNANTNSAVSNTNKISNTNTQTGLPTTAVDMSKLDHVRGNGKITIVTFSDTECPWCKKFHETMQQVIKTYEGKVRWAYKHAFIHEKSPREAMAAECAGEQGKFWEYMDLIYANTPSNDKLPESDLTKFADQIQLNRSQFDSCFASDKYKDKVYAEHAEEKTFGGSGTPYSLVVDESGKVIDLIKGAYPFEDQSKPQYSMKGI